MSGGKEVSTNNSSRENLLSSSMQSQDVDSIASTSSAESLELQSVMSKISPPPPRILACHRRSQSVGVCELKTMISNFEISTHPPTPLSPSSYRKVNFGSSATTDDTHSTGISSSSSTLTTASTRIKSGSLIHFATPPNINANPTTTRTTSFALSSPEGEGNTSPNVHSAGSTSPNTSFNSSPSSNSSLGVSSERRKAPRKVSFKESFLHALSKPRKFIEKLSPRGNHEKQRDAEEKSELHKVLSEDSIEDDSIDLRKSLDPGILQREIIKKDLKEKNKPSKSMIGKFMSSNMESDMASNDSSPPPIRLVIDKYPITTLAKKFLNHDTILHIMSFIYLPFGRYLSKTTKTPFHKENYYKLFFGKFKLGFFQRENTQKCFLIFKHIYISDNFNIDFTEIGPLFQEVPLAKIESLTVIQFRSDSEYPSCLATLKGKLPFLLQHMTSLKKLYFNTEFITSDDINSLLVDTETSTTLVPNLPIHHKEHHGLFHHRKTKQKTCNLNQSKVHHIMNNLEELVLGSLQDLTTVNIQNLPNLNYFVWRTRIDGTLLFNSQPETFNCTTLELSKVMLKPNQLKLLFSGLPKLANLKIEYLPSRLSHNSVCELQENKNLKRLTLRYCKNTDYNIGDVICISVSNHPNLCLLDISGMETRDEAIQYLLITNAGKNVINTFKCKGRLMQTDNNSEAFSTIQGPGFKDVQLNTMLNSLDLSNHPITIEGLTIICQSTSITQLILRNCSIDNAKIAPLVSPSNPLCNRIKILDLSRNLLNDRFMIQTPLFSPRNQSPPAYWKNLKSLNLGYNPMSVNVLKNIIAHCSTLQHSLKKSLKSLFVNGLNIRDEGLILVLFTFGNLEDIEAINCGITNKSLHMLGNSKNIKRCKVNQNQIIFDKMLLTNLLIQNTTLESLGLVSCIPPQEKDFKRIAKHLVANHTLQSITLNHCYFPIESEEPVEECSLTIDHKAEDNFRATCSHVAKIKFFNVQIE